MGNDEIKERVMRVFESKVRNLSWSDYKWVLEKTIADLEARLDSLNEEMTTEEE